MVFSDSMSVAGIRGELVARRRGEGGKYLQNEDPLGKTVGLRLHARYDEPLMRAAEQRGMTPTELVRDVIEKWLDAQEGQSDLS